MIGNYNNTVTVSLREVYGVVRIYPVNARAMSLLSLAGTKTFSKDHLRAIEELGFTVRTVAPKLDDL